MNVFGESHLATRTMHEVKTLARELIRCLSQSNQVVVAFSGGVDSSVVAAAAYRALPSSSVAVTAVSPSVARWQIETAEDVAREIGIQHKEIHTREGDREQYVRNDSQRCFYCKQTLYEALSSISENYRNALIVSGTNADDLGDHRPGIQAGALSNVQTPLADLGIDKKQVRQLAAYFGLSNRELPASPCLASRIAYGVPVTPDRLRRVQDAEEWLRGQEFSDCRVRVHENELARVEVPLAEISRLIEPTLAAELTQRLCDMGFRYVTLDLQGLRSGNLNQVLVPIRGIND